MAAQRQAELLKPCAIFSKKTNGSWMGERRLMQLQATALFNGDIAPDMEIMAGTVTTKNGGTWMIHSSSRARNPDGTVNYTSLELV